MIDKLFKFYRRKKIVNKFNKYADADPGTVYLDTATCLNTGKKEDLTIGNHCSVGASFYCMCGGRISVGENTYIGPGSSIQAKDSIVISNNVIIANNVVITDNNNHPTSPEMRLKMSACQDYMNDELWTWKYAESAPIVIEENVWIGRDARILKGVTVGKGAIVALGAIVTHDVPAYTVVAGNPAKVVKRLTESDNEKA